MNTLEGKITTIKNKGSLSIVEVDVSGILFNTIIIESPKTASYLKEGNAIKLIFKETEVVVGKGVNHPISIQNQAIGKIEKIEKGELLSKLKIDISIGKVIAIITTDALHILKLELGEQVTTMIKTTEIMLSE